MIDYERKLHDAVELLQDIQSVFNDEDVLFHRIMWFLDTAYDEDELDEEDMF